MGLGWLGPLLYEMHVVVAWLVGWLASWWYVNGAVEEEEEEEDMMQ